MLLQHSLNVEKFKRLRRPVYTFNKPRPRQDISTPPYALPVSPVLPAPNFLKHRHHDAFTGPTCTTSTPASEFQIRKFGTQLNRLLSDIHKRAMITSMKFHDCLSHVDVHSLNTAEDLLAFESLVHVLQSLKRYCQGGPEILPLDTIEASLSQALDHISVLRRIAVKLTAGRYNVLHRFYFCREEPLRHVILRSGQYKKLLQEAVGSQAWDAQDIRELIEEVSSALTTYPISHFASQDTELLMSIAEEAASDHAAVLRAREAAQHLASILGKARKEGGKAVSEQ